MKEKEGKTSTPLTIRPLNSGYIPTKPSEHWYHFSCKKFVEKLGITNDSDQLPDLTFLVEGGDQLILANTGMSWVKYADEYHHGPSVQRPRIDGIEPRLARVSFKPSDVDIVLFTYLHWDHAFYLEELTRVRFICRETGWGYVRNPVPLHYKSCCKPIIVKDGDVACNDEFATLYGQPRVRERFEMVKGEAQITPGVSAYEPLKHCPGHVTVVVETGDEPYYCVGNSVFAMGSTDAPQTTWDELHYDIYLPGCYVDIVAVWQTIRDTVRHYYEAGVGPHKYPLLVHDVILPAVAEEYEDTRKNRFPVIELKDMDFVFDEYKGAIIDKGTKKAAAKAKTRYLSQK